MIQFFTQIFIIEMTIFRKDRNSYIEWIRKNPEIHPSSHFLWFFLKMIIYASAVLGWISRNFKIFILKPKLSFLRLEMSFDLEPESCFQYPWALQYLMIILTHHLLQLVLCNWRTMRWDMNLILEHLHRNQVEYNFLSIHKLLSQNEILQSMETPEFFHHLLHGKTFRKLGSYLKFIASKQCYFLIVITLFEFCDFITTPVETCRCSISRMIIINDSHLNLNSCVNIWLGLIE